MRRGPVWKSSGSSPSSRYWLKVKPPGATSGTHVERRYTRSAISWTVVCMPFIVASHPGGHIVVGTPG